MTAPPATSPAAAQESIPDPEFWEEPSDSVDDALGIDQGLFGVLDRKVEIGRVARIFELIAHHVRRYATDREHENRIYVQSWPISGGLGIVVEKDGVEISLAFDWSSDATT